MMSGLGIGEIARQAGIRASTVRYYESVGILPPATRINGRRSYDSSVLQTLSIIQTAQQAGFTISEIRTLVNDILRRASPSTDWEALAQRKLQEVETLLAQVQSMKRLLEEVLQCEFQELADCIYVAGQKHGVRSKKTGSSKSS
jgi:MerR family transcriptional regulator, redox-sensitive transcriptional activator SoxR